MEKVLSQGEIDALFQAAHNGPQSGPQPTGPVQVQSWDLHQAGMLRKEQLHSISQLHENFARNLTTSVGGYLRDKFEVALVSVEQLAYRDFLARVSEVTYYGSFDLQPGDASGVLQMDLSLAFPIVDLLLGGQGGVPQGTREVTEIEEMVLQGVCEVIGHELQNVWQPLGLQVAFTQRQPTAQVLRLLPAQEKTLTLSFEATMTESRGMFNIAFPSVVSSALLRKLASDLVYSRPRQPVAHRESIQKKLLDSIVEMELGTPVLPVKLSELLTMQAGWVLPLRRHIDEPVTLRLKGRDCWRARPVRSQGNCRAAQLVEHILQPEEEDPHGCASE
ncbi:MAG: FliM/FliN family flagellar motor switch protein [Candidatus Korobacteraceae bacterium]